MSILQQIIEILVGGLVQFGTGIGEGVGAMVTGLFVSVSGETQTLTIFGILIVVFAAIALTIGLSRWIMSWVTSFGSFG